MKSCCFVLVFTLLAIVLAGCSSASTPELVNDKLPKSYPFNDYFESFDDFDLVEEACAGKANWVGEAGVIFFSREIANHYVNPTKVNIYVTRTVEVGEYIVNFKRPDVAIDLTTVYKNGQSVLGPERDQAIRLALEEVSGIPSLLITYTLGYSNGTFIADNYSCSIP